ncbi:MAG: chorismate synthase [Candidatus Eisenbacteria bacterium]|nr:chorismate synthase [Candidatus Eisenbacteria bacterium]
MGSTFGRLFRVTTWGESHGGGVGVVIDGCPPLLAIDEREIQAELDRRRPGASRLASQRKERDRVRIFSGVFEGKTLGTPILLFVANEDARPEDYEAMRDLYRPSHADFTYEAKYGIRDWQGGGRASARETVGRVAAGVLARKLLAKECEAEIVAYVRSIHTLEASIDPERVRIADVEKSPVRCPDPKASRKMVDLVRKAKKEGDSLGGVVECLARKVPAGLGEPVFDKLEADLAKAFLSIPATKGFEIGSGFEGTRLKGSEHNDPFTMREGRIRTATNRSGGIQGGISNGETIVARIAFKPTATIAKMQETVSRDGKITRIRPRGRHDPCVLPRAVPVVEAMATLVLADHLLRQKAIRGR